MKSIFLKFFLAFTLLSQVALAITPGNYCKKLKASPPQNAGGLTDPTCEILNMDTAAHGTYVKYCRNGLFKVITLSEGSFPPNDPMDGVTLCNLTLSSSSSGAYKLP